jgi:UDP-N-acetylglucosamine 2-epimerase (non-hydrolysing)
MKIISVVGARPNFIKIAPFVHAIHKKNEELKISGQQTIEHILVHTGQHYDDRMSKQFFEELGIPEADINLGIGSGTHAEQVGNTMIAFEKVLQQQKPDWVVVVGDVNATLACSVTAKKEKIKCCHIEAGLRSGDYSMPEEINRLVTDSISDLLLTPDKISSTILLREGKRKESIVFVGNIMIDTLEKNRVKATSLSFEEILNTNVLPENNSKIEFFKDSSKYGLITMHRPSNVDDPRILKSLLIWITQTASVQIPFIWPIHPRTLKKIKEFNLDDLLQNCNQLLLLQPIGYLEMLKLNLDALIMLTDSGGLQEECCVLGTPFLTLRWNTERPITLTEFGGAGYLVGNNVDNINTEFQRIMKQEKAPVRPELWDGYTALRCLEAIMSYI